MPTGPYTRERSLVFRDPHIGTIGHVHQSPLVKGFTANSNDTQVVGKQKTVSWNNPGWMTRKRLLSDSRVRPGVKKVIEGQDYGSTFFSSKNTYSDNSSFGTWSSAGADGWTRTYFGRIYAASGGPNLAVWWPAVSQASISTLHAVGTTAISRTIPTNPAAGVGVALGELRDLPKIPGRALFMDHLQSFKKRGAGEYLNWEFGLKPLMNDLFAAADAVRDSEKMIAQLLRDSGRPVRRRYEFPVTETVELSRSSQKVLAYPSLGVMATGSEAYLEKSRKTTTRRWFSGCYTYHIEMGSDTLSRLRQQEQLASRLYGLRINPDLLWNLAPWSWLVDWISNLGDMINNLSAFSRDGLVLRYGYIMMESTIVDTYTHPGLRFGSGFTGPLIQEFGTVVKQRERATPFGFGLNTSGFTPRQWAILAALGITRSAR